MSSEMFNSSSKRSVVMISDGLSLDTFVNKIVQIAVYFGIFHKNGKQSELKDIKIPWFNEKFKKIITANSL